MELARVIIFTNDVVGLVDFYVTHFGLTVFGEIDPEWTELNAGGCRIAFHKAGKGRFVKGDNGVKLVFHSNDVAGEKARLEGLGVKMSKIMEFGEIQMCDGSDPNGHRFQVSSR